MVFGTFTGQCTGIFDIKILDTNLKPENEKVCVQVHSEDIPRSQHSFKEKTDIHIWDAAKIIIFAVPLQDLCNIFVILAKMYLCAYKKVWEPVHSFTLSHCFVTIEQNSCDDYL